VIEKQNAQISLMATSFTHREREVLDHVLRGLTNKEVATRLNIASRTVEFHMTSILRKVQVSSRSQLFAMALGRD
jgi:DNA-binding CsgD family transcriptional regulator